MIVERGSGPPLVMIPGLQGRWEYQRGTIDALAASFRVITFSLETAPPGMTIDEHKGVVSWQISPDQIGVHKVRILAKDSQGAVTFQEFELNLTPAADEARAEFINR